MTIMKRLRRVALTLGVAVVLMPSLALAEDPPRVPIVTPPLARPIVPVRDPGAAPVAPKPVTATGAEIPLPPRPTPVPVVEAPLERGATGNKWAVEVVRTRDTAQPEQCWNVCQMQHDEAVAACFTNLAVERTGPAPAAKSCLDSARAQLKACTTPCPALGRNEVRP